MKPALNPFAPGAGNQPPELAGRNEIIGDAEVAFERVKAGRSDRSQLLLGLRGVGKTVLLNHLDGLARNLDYQTTFIEASEESRLTEQLVPRLRGLLLKLSTKERAKDLGLRALGALRGFASAFKVTIAGAEFEVKEEKGTADSGNLEVDLPELLIAVAETAKAGDSAVGIFVDEVQYLSVEELTALITALHRIAQKGLPLMFVGAGLPQIAKLAGDAKSYSERLFRYPEVGPLSPSDAADAIRVPLQKSNVQITPDALRLIIEQTGGYPYFLQEWGYHSWNAAEDSPITFDDVKSATKHAGEQLDQDFFRVRFDRLTQREKDYVRAMASLGPGPYRSADIAGAMGYKKADPLGSLRNDIIRKGMIYGPPERGTTAFTVPKFDEFMKRTMPNWTPPKKVG